MKPASVIALLLMFQHGAMACVGCRTPMVDVTEEPQTILAGVAFSWGVVIMLLIVSAIVGGLGFFIAKTCQRVDRENGLL
ncbi:MAG: hypothetical protein ACOYM3_22650 [Terrimicrobiaceae bacterium]